MDTDVEADADTDDVEVDTDNDTDEEPLCDLDTPVIRYISPDDSNSMSSPVLVRAAQLDRAGTARNIAIRKYEFMNYYSFPYDPAPEGELGIDVQMVHDDDMPEGQYELQIGVVAPQRTNADRAPMNVVFSVDTSCSMGTDWLGHAKDAMTAIAGNLKEGDQVSMVTWSDSRDVPIEQHVITGPGDTTVVRAIDGLSNNGGTNLSAGLRAAYQLAEAGYDAQRINRVVLLSDGGANVGHTDVEFIASKASGQEGDGIYLAGIGVGSALSYHDKLMDQVTDAGKGAALFIDGRAEAEKTLGDRFLEMMDVAAHDVQVRLDLPSGFEVVRFSGEAISADPSEVEPQNLAPNDSMVLFQTVESCAPESVDVDDQVGVTVTWNDPITGEAKETSDTFRFGDLFAGDVAMLRRGAAVFYYTRALRAAQLASTPSERDTARQIGLSKLELAEAHWPGDPELAEIRAVLESL